MNMIKIARYMAIALLAMSLVVTGLVSFFFVYPNIEEYFSRIEFNSDDWQNSESRNDTIRIRMVDDLLHNHKLVGMPRSRIDALLGKPARTPYFSDYEYVYWLGPERGLLSIDSEWLGIKFTDDLVTEASLLTD